jgi:sulfur carrier protein
MSVTIRLNGKEQAVEAGTVATVLTGLGIDPQRRGVAVAINGALVPRRTWAATPVPAGAEVEVVQPLQGG